MAVAITPDAVTLPVLELIQGGKLNDRSLGETMRTEYGVYRLIQIGSLELYDADETGIVLKWSRVPEMSDMPQ